MATPTQKLAISLRKKLNDALATHRSTAVTFEGKVEGVKGLPAKTYSGTVSREYVKEVLAERGLAGKLTDLVAEAEQNISAAQAIYDAAYAKAATITTATDATQALLDETRAAKIWQRIERQLANPKTAAGAYLAEQLEQGDALTRATILTEGPSWLQANGKAADLAKYATHIIPELSEASTELVNAQNYRNVVQANTRKVESAVDRGLTDPPASVDDLKRFSGTGYLDADTAIYG